MPQWPPLAPRLRRYDNLVDIETSDRSQSFLPSQAYSVLWMRKYWWKALLAVIALGIMLRLSRAVVSIFHWAEDHVDGNSPTHMLLFWAVSLIFHTGVPIPVVMQAWALAIGCFFRWKAFLILFASFGVGVPMSFLIGRRVAEAGGAAMEQRILQVAPKGVAYMQSLQKAVAQRPVRLSFLLMWAPLPTSFCPFLVGFLLPPKELSLSNFVKGALPSKLLHFSCQVFVGIEAGSFTNAMASHEGTSEDGSDKWAKTIAIGSLLLSVVLIGAMMVYIHQALHDIKEKEDRALAQQAEDLV